MTTGKTYSVPDAAKFLGLAVTTIRDQIRAEKIVARKAEVGTNWVITEAEVLKYQSTRLGNQGRPMGSRTKKNGGQN
jgi:hypothetical protein